MIVGGAALVLLCGVLIVGVYCKKRKQRKAASTYTSMVEVDETQYGATAQ